MSKRLLIVLAVVTALFTAFLAGCGNDEPEAEAPAPEQTQQPPVTSEDTELDQKIEELKNRAMTVEVFEDGESIGKWSQDGKGSWRLEEPAGEIYIYNADMEMAWRISDDTATELDPAFMPMYEASSPMILLSAYSVFALGPRTDGGDDVWEWNLPGIGSLKIEFKEPEGLISRIISESPDADKKELEFEYTDVDDVPEDLFELPDDVAVVTID
ncbi:MAG: hypothetical protein IBX61_08275 [Thermoleophilia bacterium]|nr:hypothetical protein [Thermoleophilia bacterium]